MRNIALLAIVFLLTGTHGGRAEVPAIGKDRDFSDRVLGLFTNNEDIKQCEKDEDALACMRLLQSNKFGKNDTAIIFYHLGNIQAKFNKHKAAVKSYREALNRLDNRDFLFAEAAQYSVLRNYEQAIADYDAIILTDNTDATALLRRGEALLNSQREDRLAKALEDFDAAAKNGADSDPSLYMNRGIAKARAQLYAEAVLDLSQAIERDPFDTINDRYDLFYSRAVSYFHLSRYDDALSDIAAALSLAAKNPAKQRNLYELRGMVFSSTGLLAQALVELDKALNLDPSNSDASRLFKEEGDVYYGKREFARAIEKYSDALDKETNSKTYVDRGNAYFSTRRYQEARNDYLLALEADASNVEARLGMAKALRILLAIKLAIARFMINSRIIAGYKSAPERPDIYRLSSRKRPDWPPRFCAVCLAPASQPHLPRPETPPLLQFPTTAATAQAKDRPESPPSLFLLPANKSGTGLLGGSVSASTQTKNDSEQQNASSDARKLFWELFTFY